MSHVWDRYSVIQGHGQSISQLLPTCTAVALTFPAERRSPRGLWQTLAKKTHTHADLSTRKTRRWRRCGLLGCGNRQRCWRGVVWRWLSPGRAVCMCVCGGTGVPALGRVNLSTATGSGSGPTDCALGVNAVYSSVPYLHITIATAILSRCVNVTN